MAGSVLCADVSVGGEATERDQVAPPVGSLPLLNPSHQTPKEIPKLFTSSERSQHREIWGKEGAFQGPLHVRNRLDLGGFAQAVSSMLSSAQGLAKEQRIGKSYPR